MDKKLQILKARFVFAIFLFALSGALFIGFQVYSFAQAVIALFFIVNACTGMLEIKSMQEQPDESARGRGTE